MCLAPRILWLGTFGPLIIFLDPSLAQYTEVNSPIGFSIKSL